MSSSAASRLTAFQAENFALAQAEDEDQHIGRVERIMIAFGGLQEFARLVRCPGFDSASARLGHMEQASDVPGDQFFSRSVGQRAVQDDCQPELVSMYRPARASRRTSPEVPGVP